MFNIIKYDVYKRKYITIALLITRKIIYNFEIYRNVYYTST